MIANKQLYKIVLFISLTIGVLFVSFSWNSQISVESRRVVRIGVDTALTTLIINNRSVFEPVFDAGVCLSWNPLPTTADRIIRRDSNQDSVRIPIRNLKPLQVYYMRPFVTTVSGTIYGPQRTFVTDSARLGSKYYGGKLFYIFKPNDPGYVPNEFHGLVYVPLGNPRYQWSTVSFQNTLIGGLDSSIGSGPQNTTKIVTTIGAGTYAAKVCNDLILEGYSDWYLPPIDEVMLIRSNIFWSSTEFDSSRAWSKMGARANHFAKSAERYVGAVRKF